MHTPKTSNKAESHFHINKLLSRNIQVWKAQTGLAVPEELVHIWYISAETCLKFVSNGRVQISKTLIKAGAVLFPRDRNLHFRSTALT